MPESVVRIDFPQWDPTKPEPHLLTGHRTFQLFHKRHAEPDTVAIVEFDYYVAARFGPPSDNTFFGHRLSDKGLQYHAAHEVEQSSWLAEVAEIERYRASPGWVQAHKHYVFTFHDETVECLAQGYRVTEYIGSMVDAVAGRRDVLTARLKGIMRALPQPSG